MKLIKQSCFFLVLLIAYSCNSQNKTATTADPDTFEKDISQKDVQVLDVRTAAEFSSGHISHAMQADWLNQQQFKDRTQHLDKNKPVYVYCASGVRSAAAGNWLRENGYTNVTELEKGITAWKQKNKPVEGGKQEKQMSLDEYNQLIPATGTVLADFGAEWCPPCVKMAPVLTDIENELKDSFKLIKIDVGVHTDILNPLKVDSYPTFIIYKNGKETWRHSGIISKQELTANLQS